ncbi:MAG: hypothetical protein AAF721_04010 [Myxococcota bacterium]
MPYLGDYLGNLFAELTIAREQADGETVRLAELYADHEYLKHFPVPRVRIHETQLEVPVVVVNTREAGADLGPRGGPSAADAGLAFDEVVAKHLERLQLTPAQEDQIRGGLAREYQLLRRRMPEGLDAGGLAGRLTRSLGRELIRAQVGEDDRKKTIQSVREDAKEALLLKAAPPSRILVGVKSAEIRDAQPDSVMRLSIKLGEEAMEWTVLDQEGETSILSPE